MSVQPMLGTMASGRDEACEMVEAVGWSSSLTCTYEAAKATLGFHQVSKSAYLGRRVISIFTMWFQRFADMDVITPSIS